VECIPDQGKAVRLQPNEFEPKEFKENEAFRPTELNPHGEWHQVPGDPAVAAVSNAYFSQALVPLSGRGQPGCLLQVEHRWDSTRYQKRTEDPNGGSMYRARLAYPSQVLQPNESAEYDVLSYTGPKARDVLAQAGGGQHRLLDLIDLGFFTSIAKI